ncbi:MAG: hypothetical protein QOG48_1423 [Verrucomicrobiota bacterium]|jgi:hypothetical protein
MKNKKDAPAGERNSLRLRKKDKMIRLDDLIPKKDVLGGRQLFFGASDITQSTTTATPTQEN